ncbi:ParB N-terminal domain-containing protein [bacterium]|nr:ParB N-terminal domain-containing protein [bacterium]
MMQVVQLPVSRIKEWAENPRKNDQAVGAVEKSIERFGFNVPVLCDRDSRLRAGHTRLKAARRLGLKNIPAIILSLSEKDKKAFAIAENKTGELAEWDSGKLKHILKQLRDEDFDLKTLGFVGKSYAAYCKTTGMRKINRYLCQVMPKQNRVTF